MEHAPTFLGDLALVLVVAAGTGILFRWLRQPVVLGYLLAGVIVGPYLPIPLFADAERVEALAQFGVVLVMFSVGLEFSFRRLARVLPSVGLPALVQMSTMAWLGILVGRGLGWSNLESIFLGACLAISSTMVVVRALDESSVPKPTAELALGILVSQDLVAVLAIAALTAVVSGVGLSTAELLVSGAELVLFLLGLVVAGLLTIPPLMRRLLRFGNPEMLVVAVTGFCFGMALIAEEMGFSVALGAFLAGSLVAESGEGHRIETVVRPIRDLFAAVFFVAVGMAVDPRLVWKYLELGFLVVAVIIVGQLLSVTVGGTLAGRGLATSVRAGATLGQIGEFSFIIASLGIGAGVVRPDLYPVVVLAALVTTFTTPLVLRFSDRIIITIDHLLPDRLRRMLYLYPSWLDALSERTREKVQRTRSRRLLAALCLDVVVLVALTIVAAVASGKLAESLARETGLEARVGRWLVIGSCAVLAVPFLIGVLRVGRRLGEQLARDALPLLHGKVDLARAPRRSMSVLLQVAVVLFAALVYTAATQPFLPAGWGIFILLLSLGSLALAGWRTSADLSEHVQAGAQALAAGLLRHSGQAHEGLEEIENLLPGMGEMTPVAVAAGDPVLGESLAALNLRSRTGVTVLAVRRAGDVHALPGGDWTLQPGDLLGLTGSAQALERALEVLKGPPEPEPEEPPSAVNPS